MFKNSEWGPQTFSSSAWSFGWHLRGLHCCSWFISACSDSDIAELLAAGDLLLKTLSNPHGGKTKLKSGNQKLLISQCLCYAVMFGFSFSCLTLILQELKYMWWNTFPINKLWLCDSVACENCLWAHTCFWYEHYPFFPPHLPEE